MNLSSADDETGIASCKPPWTRRPLLARQSMDGKDQRQDLRPAGLAEVGRDHLIRKRLWARGSIRGLAVSGLPAAESGRHHVQIPSMRPFWGASLARLPDGHERNYKGTDAERCCPRCSVVAFGSPLSSGTVLYEDKGARHARLRQNLKTGYGQCPPGRSFATTRTDTGHKGYARNCSARRPIRHHAPPGGQHPSTIRP